MAKCKEEGEDTGHVDYLGNKILVGDVLVYSDRSSGTTYTFYTGTVTHFTPMKFKCKRFGYQWEEWVEPLASVHIGSLKEK